ncbi:MAG: hypothetical protein IK115_06940 [Lachnospiraceae bacterium]|nr:hypothetical protein [Lachnospiraceae bacterium]
MKKKLLCLLSILSLLAACGTKEADEPESPGSTEEEPVVTALQPAEAPTEAPVEAEPTEAAEQKDHVFSSCFKNASAEGSGNYFVRAGRKVYYRVTDPAALPEFALYDNFLNEEDPYVDSILCCYDLDTHEYKELFPVNGDGALYIGREGLFLGNSSGNHTSLIDPESGELTAYCEGLPVAVSPDGRTLAASYWASAGEIYSFYREGERLCEFNTANTDVLSFIDFAGDTLVGLARHGEDGAFYLVGLKEDGSLSELGDIPEAESSDTTSWPEVIQFLSSRDSFWLSLGYYEGTGHFLSEWFVLSGDVSGAGTLSTVDSASGDANFCEPVIELKGDSLEIYKGMGQRIEAKNPTGTSGFMDLVYHVDQKNDMVLATNFLYDYTNDYVTEWRDFLTEAVIYEETAFTITFSAQHIREQDIGWREAFIPHDYDYKAIPFDENSRNDDGTIAYPILLSWGYYSAPIPELSELEGEWELYSYELEGNFGLIEDEPGSEKYMEIDADGNGTVKYYDGGTGKYDMAEMELFDNEDYEGRPSWKVYRGDWPALEYTVMSLIEDRLHISVEWTNTDGTPGGSDYVFHRVTD